MESTITKEELTTLVDRICMEQCDDYYNEDCEHDAIRCGIKYLIHELKLKGREDNV